MTATNPKETLRATLQSAYDDWCNATTTAQLYADPEEENDPEEAEAAAEEALKAWDDAATLFMNNADRILAALTQPDAHGLREKIADLISEAAQTKGELLSDETTSNYRHGWQSGWMAALDEVRQALASGGPDGGWQTMDSAPTNGTHFLAGQWFVDDGEPDFHCAVTWWSNTWGFGGDTRVENPTHWQPLPSPPQSAEGGA